jgi:hypothetical protein
VFYSEVKKGFVLGGLGNAILVNQKNRGNTQVGYNLAGVPYYLPKYLVEIGKRRITQSITITTRLKTIFTH